MKTIINFFKGLFNESGVISSKRVEAFEILHVIFLMVIGEQFFHKPINMIVLETLGGMFLTLNGFNALLQSKAMGVKKDVASDIVNNTGDNDSAKDVLKSDKPSS